jgi:MerR family transcriptional regulator, light-induced transcriptional regulator
MKKYVGNQFDSLLVTVIEKFKSELQPLQPKPGVLTTESVSRGIQYILVYLEEALQLDKPTIFLESLSWFQKMIPKYNLNEPIVYRGLEIILEELKPYLNPTDYHACETLITQSLEQQRQTNKNNQPIIELSTVAQSYLDLLLQIRRSEASQLIMDLVNQGMSVKEVYEGIFQPVLYEVGRLWEIQQISIAQEHYCTTTTQAIMSQLHPIMFRSEKKGKRFIGSCIGKELHDVGIRMVTDFFEMDGWDTYYIGANTPRETLLESIQQIKPNLVGLSVTMYYYINEIKELVQEVRTLDSLKQIKIIVGGNAFNSIPDLWKEIGADGFASRASEAVASN